MKITQSMVDFMKSFSIAAMCEDNLDDLHTLYKAGLEVLGTLSKEEVMTPEQASSIIDFFRDVIRNEDARIENNK